MKKLICYIPFFVRRPDAYDELNQTIKSLNALSANILSVNIFHCQPEQEKEIRKSEKDCNQMGFKFEVRQVSVPNPLLLPTAVYHIMQKEGASGDLCFYLESDHVIHIKSGFLDLVFDEMIKGNVVMPHRLGKWPIHKDREPVRWGEYFVGNYAPPGIHAFSDTFNSVTEYYSAYAGVYFAQRSVIQKYRLSYPLMMNIVWRGFAEHVRRLSHRRLFGDQAPHGLLLEGPSLLFQANLQTVLKPKNIEDFYIVHLSQDGGV